MHAAQDAAHFQAALELEHINVIRNEYTQSCAGVVVFVLDSKKCDIILHGKVQMCVVAAEHTPGYILAALALCSRRKVIVWKQSSAHFKDLADCTLSNLTPCDVHALCLFVKKMHNNVEDTKTLQGTWCELRIGKASVETTCYTHILGTVVLSNAVEHVLAQLRATLFGEASPRLDNVTRARARFTETTFEDAMV